MTDFFCAEARLCVEVDGGVHFDPGQAEYDIARTGMLKTMGYRVIRFTNADVMKDLPAVLQAILAACDSSVPESFC